MGVTSAGILQHEQRGGVVLCNVQISCADRAVEGSHEKGKAVVILSTGPAPEFSVRLDRVGI
jgi:hypothetical protein